MVLLIDSDVLMDYILEREPFFEVSKKIVELRRQKKIIGYMTTQCIANIVYLLRKKFTLPERKNIIIGLCRSFRICSVTQEIIKNALYDHSFTDFEDHLQSLCAQKIHADYIITRNTKDFTLSVVPALTPDDYISNY